MRLVMIETPRGIARTTVVMALRDCIQRHESPIYPALTISDAMARHTLEAMVVTSTTGVEMETAWVCAVDAVIFYMDNGLSPHMERALRFIDAHRPNAVTEFRWLAPASIVTKGSVAWEMWAAGVNNSVVSTKTPAQHRISETDWGRLEVCYNRRPPSPPAPFEVKLAGTTVAFYATMEQAMAGAEAFYCWRRTTVLDVPGLPGIPPLVEIPGNQPLLHRA